MNNNHFSATLVTRRKALIAIAGIGLAAPHIEVLFADSDTDRHLWGYWPLENDFRDYSGNDRHAIAPSARPEKGTFDGQSTYLEIPCSKDLGLGREDFTIATWIRANSASTDTVGDVIGKWDPASRRGFTLCVKGSSGGYNSHGSERNVHFGIDDAHLGEWQDCGRPNRSSNYVSNSLTVFDGDLYAATSDAVDQADWCHVYRYAGGQNWEDCGRVGNLKTRGVGPLVVHNSQLYAATWSYDWNRVAKDDLDFCRVYRYGGGKSWEDCGQPGECRRLFGIASYQGRLFVAGDDNCCHESTGDGKWKVSRKFRSLVHPMAVHNGRLFAGEFGGNEQGAFRQAEVFAFDGEQWKSAGSPMQPGDREDQIHALHSHEGRLHATTWPRGKVAALDLEGRWTDRGRLGASTESNALNVYNGKLYAGTIPLGEVYRNDGPADWTRVGRFSPEDEVNTPMKRSHWGRVTSLTVFAGRLFASVGSYTSSILDAPPDTRGRVFSIQAGNCISYNKDMGSNWRFLLVARRSNQLEMYLDGQRVAASEGSTRPLDLTNDAPLRIGFGPNDYFAGSIRDVRLWRCALPPSDIARYLERRPKL